MPVPTTSQDLLALVRKSALVDEEQLEQHLEQMPWLGQDGAHASPARVCNDLVRVGLLTVFQARQLLGGKWRGFRLGDYRILHPLGKGGMGMVFLAQHVSRPQRVAVKVLAGKQANSGGAVARFRREARALAALSHPNIVGAIDAGQEGDRLFLVMEHVAGVSVRDVVASHGPLTVAWAIEVIRQTALGLQHAHAAGWVHRDVKPSNLLLTREGNVKLLDLGLALLCEDEDDCLTRAGTGILGTADYLAPEQSLDSHEVDGRADIYSLGATLYHLLAGQPPFPGGTVLEKVQRHRQARPRPLRLCRAGVPVGVEAIVERMLAKKPEQRYPSPQAVIEALTPWVRHPGPVPALWLARLPARPPQTQAVSSSPAQRTTSEQGTIPTAEAPALIPTEPVLELEVVQPVREVEAPATPQRSWRWWGWGLLAALAAGAGLAALWLH